MHVDGGGHRVRISLDIVLVAWHPAADGLECGADTLIAAPGMLSLPRS
jgi:hypothetical protein